VKLFVAASLLIFGSASSYTATQTDWSGGPGVWGPVTAWGDDFSLDTGPLWFATPGYLCLAIGVEHMVDSDFTTESVYSDDIDGDGDVDVAGASVGDGVAWWMNLDGLGTVWMEIPIDGSVHANSVCSDYMDGDGYIDVLGASMLDDDVTWWENVNGWGMTWTEHLVDGSFDGAISICSDDINGDGDIDVIGAAYEANEIAWWENADGQGTVWFEHLVGGSFPGAISVCSDDVDGDGDIDVIGAAFDLFGYITWWENADGLGTVWIEHAIDGSFQGANSVCSDDIDGDGDIDVIGAGMWAYTIAWWENADGLGAAWIEHTIDGSFETANSVHSDDIDCDGDIDVLGASLSSSSDDIAWWENGDGLGSIWIEHTVSKAFGSANSVYSDDVNGDGEVDVIGGRGGGSIAWWELSAYPGDACLESSILHTGDDPDWGTLLWSAQAPPGTSVTFQVRASDDYAQMGAWSDTLAAPCSLHGILADNASYVQYRAILETADPDTTPTLLDLTVTWDPLGTGGSGPRGTCLLPVAPNPSSSSPSIDFSLAETGTATLCIYDLSGRLVREFGTAEYPAGAHTIQLQPLSPGIYFVRMRAGEFIATQRFAVVE
jgi:hypothetical protein